jgi:hypothetical protein
MKYNTYKGKQIKIDDTSKGKQIKIMILPKDDRYPQQGNPSRQARKETQTNYSQILDYAPEAQPKHI